MTETVSQALQDRALIEEATKKSGLIWVRGSGPARALWHLWHDGAACLIGDGSGEQPLADLGLTDGGTATVTVRSKDKGGRLIAWQARVVEAGARKRGLAVRGRRTEGQAPQRAGRRHPHGALGAREPGAAAGADRGGRAAPRADAGGLARRAAAGDLRDHPAPRSGRAAEAAASGA